jgi:hypothetical protein
VLSAFLRFEIDGKYATMTLALLAAPDDRSRNQFWKTDSHVKFLGQTEFGTLI